MIKRGIKFVISFFFISAIFFNFPSNALANMGDWKLTNAKENLTGNWVYYVYSAANALYQGIHFSRHVDNSYDDHIATDDRMYYYYGNTRSFNTPNIPQQIRDTLIKAWQDYFSVS
ncbi:hypothetical protein [Microcoleus sp. OTE_8_concoct_300]|uniref:hypothetical protein n=1 Tax=Microcoleus sp. OTE_8_concoct_300 TaxID=2964710 RepID=UPI00403F8DC7